MQINGAGFMQPSVGYLGHIVDCQDLQRESVTYPSSHIAVASLKFHTRCSAWPFEE